jgi:hypothetical protein
MPTAARILSHVGRQRGKPTGAARTQQPEAHGSQYVAAVKIAAVMSHEGGPFKRPQKGAKSHKKLADWFSPAIGAISIDFCDSFLRLFVPFRGY